jgi:DNA-binding NtrC family response regulator
MSRLHFRVVHDPRLLVYRVGDGGSTNGTFVNGERVTSGVLMPGAVVRAGSSLFVYEESETGDSLTARAADVGASSLSVLLQGDTGTGKEWVARRIHTGSSRKGRFVAVNCATLTPELAAAELFGHTKGAFSGAAQDRSGLFVAAHGGTLFLDEIADLLPHLQAVLLRVLEDKMVRPVGSDREVAVDVRIIAACQMNLEQRADAGDFRPDLYARLAQAVIQLPPLRSRRAEIVSILRSVAAELDVGEAFSVDAVEALLLWRWPYNVRELRSLLQTFAAFRQRHPVLDREFLIRHRPDIGEILSKRAEDTGNDGEEPVRSAPRMDRVRLRNALQAHQGNIARVAEEFGTPRAQVYRWLRALGLSAASFRSNGTRRT